jgi:hypothetical protein
MDITANILQTSIDFLMTVLRGDPTDDFFQFFSSIEAGSILGLLEEEKKVFWINIYNALVQIELHEMTSEKVDKSIFSKKVIEIAGESMSLDNIEHGILRGNFWKYGLGFLPGGYLNKKNKNWKSKRLEPRIHFQLNCGAASCPVIRPLQIATLETELNLGEEDFIISETRVDENAKKFVVSRLFLFYIKHFGGVKGIRKRLAKHFPGKN